MSCCVAVKCPNCGSDDIHIFTEHISCSSTVYCRNCRKVKADVPYKAKGNVIVRLWNERCRKWDANNPERGEDMYEE